MDEPRTDYLMLIGGEWTDGQGEPFSLVSKHRQVRCGLVDMV